MSKNFYTSLVDTTVNNTTLSSINNSNTTENSDDTFALNDLNSQNDSFKNSNDVTGLSADNENLIDSIISYSQLNNDNKSNVISLKVNYNNNNNLVKTSSNEIDSNNNVIEFIVLTYDYNNGKFFGWRGV
jgi:hypothetical protein